MRFRGADPDLGKEEVAAEAVAFAGGFLAAAFACKSHTVSLKPSRWKNEDFSIKPEYSPPPHTHTIAHGYLQQCAGKARGPNLSFLHSSPASTNMRVPFERIPHTAVTGSRSPEAFS